MLEFDDPDGDQGLGEVGDVGTQGGYLGLQGGDDLGSLIVDEALAPAQVERHQAQRPDLRLVEHIRAAGVLCRGALALALALALAFALRLAFRLALDGGGLGCLRTRVIGEVLVAADVDGHQAQ